MSRGCSTATDDLNGRQLALLTDAVRHPDASIRSTATPASHRVTHETARSDLRGLAERGLLVRRRKGRRHRLRAGTRPDRAPERIACMSSDAYAKAGVDQGAADSAVAGLVRALGAIELGRPSRQVPLPGHYASVIRIDERTGIALSTDGVGTKLVVAEQLGRFDTVGIDCVAMNVNDVICVGAEPLAMLDYIAIDRADPAVCEEIGVGLARGAELAGIEIPGGELAQLGEHGPRRRRLRRLLRHRRPRRDRRRLRRASRATRSSACPPPACTPTATPWPARRWTGSRSTRTRKAPRPAARRRAARADRDLRQAGARAAALRGRRPRPRPHHLRRARQPAAARRRGRLRDRRPAARAADLRADPGARRHLRRGDARGLQHGLRLLLRRRRRRRGRGARAAPRAITRGRSGSARAVEGRTKSTAPERESAMRQRTSIGTVADNVRS